jgi:hypothetical protein
VREIEPHAGNRKSIHFRFGGRLLHKRVPRSSRQVCATASGESSSVLAGRNLSEARGKARSIVT